MRAARELKDIWSSVENGFTAMEPVKADDPLTLQSAGLAYTEP